MNRAVPIKNSFIIRIVVLVAVVQVVTVIGSGFLFINKLDKYIRDKALRDNVVAMHNTESFVSTGINSFAENMQIIASSPLIASFDTDTVGHYLKNYKISSILISGEEMSVYDNNNTFVGNAIMAGDEIDTSGYEHFTKVVPIRPFFGPVIWKRGLPYISIAVTIQNRAEANGILAAEHAFRRYFEYVQDYSIGKGGYTFVIDRSGDIILHPDTRYMKDQANIEDIGLKGIVPESFSTGEYSIKRIFGERYFINYTYNQDLHIGFFAVQPEREVNQLSMSVKTGMIVLLLLMLVLSLSVIVWMLMKFLKPVNQLTANMLKVKNGDLEGRVTIKRRDELGVMADVFNLMRKRIKSNIEQLSRHKEELEEKVRERTAELQKANRFLERMSRTDTLTGLPNRRDVLEKIEYEKNRTERTKSPFVFVMVDIDHFKNFNDTWGHECGDFILSELGILMKAQLRKHDHIARWGGEEFLIVLTETEQVNARRIAERIRRTIAEKEFIFDDELLKVTITIGVARFDPVLGIDGSISKADKALYKGKERSRNVVIVE